MLDQAVKVADQCSDLMTQSDLRRLCERIPSIGIQLKILASVKAAGMGNDDHQDPAGAETMLIVNAQNLMDT